MVWYVSKTANEYIKLLGVGITSGSVTNLLSAAHLLISAYLKDNRFLNEYYQFLCKQILAEINHYDKTYAHETLQLHLQQRAEVAETKQKHYCEVQENIFLLLNHHLNPSQQQAYAFFYKLKSSKFIDLIAVLALYFPDEFLALNPTIRKQIPELFDWSRYLQETNDAKSCLVTKIGETFQGIPLNQRQKISAMFLADSSLDVENKSVVEKNKSPYYDERCTAAFVNTLSICYEPRIYQKFITAIVKLLSMKNTEMSLESFISRLENLLPYDQDISFVQEKLCEMYFGENPNIEMHGKLAIVKALLLYPQFKLTTLLREKINRHLYQLMQDSIYLREECLFLLNKTIPHLSDLSQAVLAKDSTVYFNYSKLSNLSWTKPFFLYTGHVLSQHYHFYDEAQQTYLQNFANAIPEDITRFTTDKRKALFANLVNLAPLIRKISAECKEDVQVTKIMPLLSNYLDDCKKGSIESNIVLEAPDFCNLVMQYTQLLREQDKLLFLEYLNNIIPRCLDVKIIIDIYCETLAAWTKLPEQVNLLQSQYQVLMAESNATIFSHKIDVWILNLDEKDRNECLQKLLKLHLNAPLTDENNLRTTLGRLIEWLPHYSQKDCHLLLQHYLKKLQVVPENNKFNSIYPMLRYIVKVAPLFLENAEIGKAVIGMALNLFDKASRASIFWGMHNSFDVFIAYKKYFSQQDLTTVLKATTGLFTCNENPYPYTKYQFTYIFKPLIFLSGEITSLQRKQLLHEYLREQLNQLQLTQLDFVLAVVPELLKINGLDEKERISHAISNVFKSTMPETVINIIKSY